MSQSIGPFLLTLISALFALGPHQLRAASHKVFCLLQSVLSLKSLFVAVEMAVRLVGH